MNAYDAYRLFLSIKMHFDSSSYDAVKYNFKVSASPESFNRRRDQYHFNKLSKLRDPKGFLIANFVGGDANWIGDLISDGSEEVYTSWLKRQESLTYIVSGELDKLETDFVDFFKVKQGQHPPLLKLYRQKKICIETLIVLNDILNFFPVWDMKITDTIIWPQVRNTCVKYQSFLHYDRKKFKKIILELATPDK